MQAYSKAYLDEIVENQGKLFDYIASAYTDMDTEDFIQAYMKSATRRYLDEAKAYVCTMDVRELWSYFQKIDGYQLKKGMALTGFMPDWIGEFYAYYQWRYNVPSAELVDRISLDYLEKMYPGLHDLELDLAVEKVGAV